MSDQALLAGRTPPAAAPAPRRPRPYRPLVWYVLVTALAVVVVYPVIWMLGTSFKPATEIVTSNRPWPLHWTGHNFPDGWHANPGVTFGRFFANSLVISGFAVVGTLVSCSLAAYAFSRLEFRGRSVMFAGMVVTILLPYHVLIVPQYAIFKRFGWINTDLPLIAPKFLATEAFFIFLMVQFMRGIPREIDEAARLDGCGPYRTYLWVVLPLTRPALITSAIFSFIWTWNDFFTQLVYLNDTSKFTVPIGLSLFVDQTGMTSYGPMMAMSVLALAPVFLFFLAFQRLLVDGATSSGLKG
ncbi:carbohydrate ABC transporter permease [Actinacidiphila epipremni]|jgi:multiple sugar transport system permease protein|uniref:Carbohydrate ABC transporter permease n=1 Tax=Actinacidiphila epipremni TaxID=2053013 RepID=A0ABX0ZQ22_9ACTN|nr:carbohydrate ABC transporter permease [Actinacidiphila epipremni]NJP44394.1 carbohydrate ABC transporter permease [Actinacidiphila epipremni]